MKAKSIVKIFSYSRIRLSLLIFLFPSSLPIFPSSFSYFLFSLVFVSLFLVSSRFFSLSKGPGHLLVFSLRQDYCRNDDKCWSYWWIWTSDLALNPLIFARFILARNAVHLAVRSGSRKVGEIAPDWRILALICRLESLFWWSKSLWRHGEMHTPALYIEMHTDTHALVCIYLVRASLQVIGWFWNALKKTCGE